MNDEKPQTDQAEVFKSINVMSVGVSIFLSIGMVMDKNSVTVSFLSGCIFYLVVASLMILWQPDALPYVLTHRQREITERKRDERQHQIHLRQLPRLTVDPLPTLSTPPASLPDNGRFVPAIAAAETSVERQAGAWIIQLYGENGEPDPAKVLTKDNTDKPDQIGRIRIIGPSKAAKQWLLQRRIIFNMGTAYRLNVTRYPTLDHMRAFLSSSVNGATYPTHPPDPPTP